MTVQLGNLSQVKMAGMKFFKKGVVGIHLFQTARILAQKIAEVWENQPIFSHF